MRGHGASQTGYGICTTPYSSSADASDGYIRDVYSIVSQILSNYNKIGIPESRELRHFIAITQTFVEIRIF